MRGIKKTLKPLPDSKWERVYYIFIIFLRLGCTSFGGPIAAIGYFREEFVERRKWLHEHVYADLVGLCQLLPGPASSQTAIGIGLLKAGYLGALAAWLGFVMPSAILLALFGLGITKFSYLSTGGWIEGAKTVAVAVIALAVWRMGQALCPDRPRLIFAAVAALLASFLAPPFAQISAIVSGGILGWLFLKNQPNLIVIHAPVSISKQSAIIAFTLFFSLLIFPPLIWEVWNNHVLFIFNNFFRSGALIFGGAHVVLPLLQSITVPQMITNDLFLAGYGIAQAIPGPLLSFAAYLGAASKVPPNGWLGASICLIAIYLPSFLLLIGLLPFWEKVRHSEWTKPVMQGLNAAVVGLLAAALYNPVWKNSILNWKDFVFALCAFLLLSQLKWPSWLVVLLGVSLGQLLL